MEEQEEQLWKLYWSRIGKFEPKCGDAVPYRIAEAWLIEIQDLSAEKGWPIEHWIRPARPDKKRTSQPKSR